MKNVFVLGAGPAGLAVADGLASAADVSTTIIEAASQPGGLAQTLTWNGHGSHDLGPHKLFTTNKALEARVRALLPDDKWLLRPKVSRIYMNGHFLPYPPSPLSFVKLYGVFEFLLMGVDFAKAKLLSFLPASASPTFESDLSARVGRRLYEGLFKPIAVKLWGDPKKLDAKLSKSRVQTPSLPQLLAKSVGIKSATQTSEALEFFYPQGGLQSLWSSLLGRARNVNLLTGHRVTGLQTEGKRVTRILTANAAGGEKTFDVAPGDWVVSTLPMSATVAFLKNALPSGAQQIINDYVVLNDLILVFLKIRKTRLMQDAWVFIPDAALPFHRISEQAAFDPGMTPDGSIVCCEIMSHGDRPFMAKSDAELARCCIDGLSSMGFDTAGSETWESRVIRLPKSYPVYKAGYEKAVSGLLDGLDTFENFKTVGRQGSFNYIGSLDAMDIGYGVAEWLLQAGAAEARDARWRAERERTAHFPVLD